MSDETTPDPIKILQDARLLVTREAVMAAVDRMSDEINAYYEGKSIIVLAVMTGAIMPVAWIGARLTIPVRLDFIHATRYQGQTEGGELEFRVPPRLNLQDQDILVVDDIYDVGLTLQLIEAYCAARGARSVNSAVLVRKIHDRETTESLPRFIGMDVEDKYVFGCGMDAYEHWRHLDQIYALETD